MSQILIAVVVTLILAVPVTYFCTLEYRRRVNKVVPQISIFVINIQMKLIVGLGLLALLYAPAGEFIEKIMTTMIKTVQGILTFL